MTYTDNEKQYVGHLVLSTAGHDKGTVLCVLAMDGEYLVLADGRRRKVQSPKRKNIKHVNVLDVPVFNGVQSNKELRVFIRNAKADNVINVITEA